MPVTELLTITNTDQTSYSHPGRAIYKVERLPRNRQIALSANVRLQPFSQFERNVISNLTTGPKLISILDVFHDASNQGKEFFSQSMGICLRQTYGPSTSPIRWRDAGMTVLMNIARVIYRGSSLL